MCTPAHWLTLTSLLPLTDITLTDSWYHHHHLQWLFPAPCLGLVRYVSFNRIIPGITEGMLLQRLFRSSGELLPQSPAPCFQGQYFASYKKTWHRIHCECLRNCLKICYQVSLIYHLLFWWNTIERRYWELFTLRQEFETTKYFHSICWKLFDDPRFTSESDRRVYNVQLW